MSSQSPPLEDPLFSLNRHLDSDITNDLFAQLVFFLELVVFEKTHCAGSFGAKPVIDSTGMDTVVCRSIYDI